MWTASGSDVARRPNSSVAFRSAAGFTMHPRNPCMGASRACRCPRNQSENFSPRSNISMIARIRLARVSGVFAVWRRYATE